MAELYIVISEALKERFRLKSTDQSKQGMLQKTDEALANWSLHLSHPLQLRITPALDIWAANLHLVYNTALTLLHRAQPHHLSDTQREDSDLCITAAAAIQSIFQCLCDKDEIKCLWTSSINCLFTALIQLGIEMRFSNPVLAISALRRYDSALFSLRELAKYWPSAQSILHFFENSVRLQDSRRGSTHVDYPPLDNQGPGASSGVRPGPTREDISADTQREVPQPPCQISSKLVSGNISTVGDDNHSSSTLVVASQQENSGADGQDNNIENIEPSWHEWRQTCWQQPEFPDDLLFTV